MSTQTVSAAPQPTVSPEVVAFAREKGVEQYLPPLIELARQVYPSATQFKVFVEEDWEIRETFIVFELDVPLTVDQSLAANRRWHEGYQQIVLYPDPGAFRKSVNLP